MTPRPLIGLIGENIALSLSPALHEDAFAALGMEGRYHLIEFAKGDRRSLADALNGARAVGMLGVNVTHPFKEAVVPLLDRMSDDARRTGAVNTVVFEPDGSTSGHNTDLSGFRAALPAELGAEAAKDKSVMVLGAGGAGRAVSVALCDLGVRRLYIVDPNRERAAGLVAALNAGRRDGIAETASPDAVASRVQGVVNASMVGMTNYPGSPIDAGLLRPDLWVGDVIYTPLKTELLVQAERRGCRTMNGGPMCVMQAVDSFRLFSGKTADVARMTRRFAEAAAARERALARS